MRRCEWSISPPSKRTSRCLPSASTERTSRPASHSGQRSRPCRGCGVSFDSIALATSASPTRRAALWMVSPSGTHPRVRSRHVKLVTWNVNSLKVRMPRLLELLEVHEPDLVFLQETKVERNTFPALELEEAGYTTAHHSGGRWAGVALLARRRLELGGVCDGLAREPARDEARWIEADVGGLRAVSVYVPNGRAPETTFYEDKLRFLEAAADRIERLAEGPLVVAGDFNVCPTDLDVYDPEAFVGSTHVTPPERERFQALLEAG